MQKYLIVGLGNIGEEYQDTRHNIGFMVVDELAKKVDQKFKPSNFGEIIQFKYKARPVTVLKPDTYMNLSGKAVSFWAKKENIPVENILVITDDLNLPFGTLRMRGKGSDGGHNGLKSIQALLGTTQYPKLRFGIGDEFSRGGQIDYVLGKWSEEEQAKMAERLDKASDACLSFVFAGLANTMNTFNGK
ncbi:aminoacyl-tRNA hydrolase [Ornithobacterium rhinotracheale]|uniref:aminoacyl-tRNA hydrolase n=1 Tax=Ornithobacterium rhinotracheale TaxID=28251 RepID=UPI00129CD4D7|nr:aminoacyl-tRNA hydrolase [Ornithobacterium rhinotracheale]MRI62828.1 aminoacyl-tRNA hydrolase [Ornithobacterium rhinotracheale]MRJ09886.1 aminoacyl-tRNA hydrolase [Ornithobacterium rhinotracheale]